MLQVVDCVWLEERAAAAGLWSMNPVLPSAACLNRLFELVTNVVGQGGLLCMTGRSYAASSKFATFRHMLDVLSVHAAAEAKVLYLLCVPHAVFVLGHHNTSRLCHQLNHTRCWTSCNASPVYPCADRASRAAAGVPALHAVITKALSAALEHLTSPRHLELLLFLSLLADYTRQGAFLLSVSTNMPLQAGVLADGLHRRFTLTETPVICCH